MEKLFSGECMAAIWGCTALAAYMDVKRLGEVAWNEWHSKLGSSVPKCAWLELNSKLFLVWSMTTFAGPVRMRRGVPHREPGREPSLPTASARLAVRLMAPALATAVEAESVARGSCGGWWRIWPGVANEGVAGEALSDATCCNAEPGV